MGSLWPADANSPGNRPIRQRPSDRNDIERWPARVVGKRAQQDSRYKHLRKIQRQEGESPIRSGDEETDRADGRPRKRRIRDPLREFPGQSQLAAAFLGEGRW